MTSARRFANRYRERWVNGQLDMGLRRLARLEDQGLADAMRTHIEELRAQALEICRREDGLRHGHDYVVACEV